jgi:acetyl-CoA carboxylase carboxyl transferase subunit alpha
MDLNFLDFEQPIADLQAKIDELRRVGFDNEINISEEIAKLEEKSRKLTESVFLNPAPGRFPSLSGTPSESTRWTTSN